MESIVKRTARFQDETGRGFSSREVGISTLLIDLEGESFWAMVSFVSLEEDSVKVRVCGCCCLKCDNVELI
jgi:hypothetical protein